MHLISCEDTILTFICCYYPEYGKLLLYRRADDRFIVKNDSILPIMWKIRNAEDFIEDFIIAQTSGIVARNDNQVVPVTYIACRVGVISVKVLTIDVRLTFIYKIFIFLRRYQ